MLKYGRRHLTDDTGIERHRRLLLDITQCTTADALAQERKTKLAKPNIL
jgi:hypothetical protein